MWTCTTRLAIAGPGYTQASANLAKVWLLHHWRLDWFSSQEVGQVCALNMRIDFIKLASSGRIVGLALVDTDAEAATDAMIMHLNDPLF
jgi:hypothetical protein